MSTSQKDTVREALLRVLEVPSPPGLLHIQFGKTSLSDQIQVLKKAELRHFGMEEETVWTVLLALGYAAGGIDGVHDLAERLSGRTLPRLDDPKIWIESLPHSPRVREGATHLDLAVGHIRLRAGTTGGIELDPSDDSWVVFSEMKCFSDISTKVTHDLERSQLARVIDNALCFQADQELVSRPIVALVTPEFFWKGNLQSRLYQFLFDAYSTNPQTLCRDLVSCHLPYRQEPPWIFSKAQVESRVGKLVLTRPSFDSLFQSLPASPLRDPIRAFFDCWSWSGRAPIQ